MSEQNHEKHSKKSEGTKGDFTTDLRMFRMSCFAIMVGTICASVALVLQRLIGFFTNVFYFQSFSIPDKLPLPADNQLGWLAIFVPVIGGLLIGIIAKYGSDRIRGHGIPEAIEAILIGQSRMQPKVAVLKPLSSAISIGSGGPFGAEGPIIMTGGAIGSLIAQAFQMTAAERKTLLVAGAAGGMAATFGTPVAAVLLAVELLLFEWKPRSFVPVALASATAALVRPHLGLDALPLFPVDFHRTAPALTDLLSAVVVGLGAGVMSLVLTRAIYLAEDAFEHLPCHWMWWPAIGGLIVGIGGYFEPRALGVGYDIIGEVLSGKYVAQSLVALMVVKMLIWSLALGSGTSGGVLAPLLIMGGVLGALESTFLPGGDTRLWPLVSMAAVMGGTMRAPLTGVIFALELTYDVRALLPLLIASTISHAFTVLILKRSILTEKIARRGHHVSQEYSVDPLELLSVEEVMTTEPVKVPASLTIKELLTEYFLSSGTQRHKGYPVVDKSGRFLGIVTRSDVLEQWMTYFLRNQTSEMDLSAINAFDLVNPTPVTAYPWESCRTAAQRMAQRGVGRLPVVSADNPEQLVGIITLSDLLKPRARQADEEVLREQFFGKNLLRRKVGKGS